MSIGNSILVCGCNPGIETRPHLFHPPARGREGALRELKFNSCAEFQVTTASLSCWGTDSQYSHSCGAISSVIQRCKYLDRHFHSEVVAPVERPWTHLGGGNSQDKAAEREVSSAMICRGDWVQIKSYEGGGPARLTIKGWRWTMVKVVSHSSGTVPRKKTQEVQVRGD